jgi:hypothetical protein
VSTVWVVWVLGLVGLLMTHAVVLIVWAVVVIAMLVFVARPLQRRAEQLVPENKVEGGKVNVAMRGGTTRDRAIRDLFYGTEPLRAAFATAGMSERWVVLRHLVVALTILALVYVVFGPTP